jgi:hypothetical protein
MPVPTGTYKPLTPQAPNEIRRFTDAGIEEAMKAQLAKLPKGRRGALVMYADLEGVKGAIYSRKKGKFFGLLPPGEWSFVATAGRTWAGELHGGAAVGYSW